MQSFLRLTGLAALFAALWLAMTWPLAAHLTTDYLGGPGSDAHQYVWNAWHFRWAVLAGTSPMYTRALLFPEGISLWLHTYTPIIGVLHLLVPIGPVAITNLALALSFGLSGAGAVWLGRRWGLGWGAAGAVGVWFAFSAFKTVHQPEHYHLLLTGAVPFYVGLLPRAVQLQPGHWRPVAIDRRALAGCAALGMVTALGDYYTTFWLLYFTAIVWAWHGLNPGAWHWRRWQLWAKLAVGLTLAHLAVRALRLAGVSDHGGLYWGADLGGYFVPPPHLALLSGPWSTAFYGHVVSLPNSPENVVYLGFLIPLLAGALLLTRRSAAPTHAAGAGFRETPALAAALGAALVFFILITVPEGRVWGHKSLRPPTALLHFVPFLNNLRCPTRAVVMVSLLAPLLALRGLGRRSWGRAAAWQWGLPVVALLEVWPTPMPRTHVPTLAAPYTAVRALAAPGSLVAMPLGIRDGMHQVGLAWPDDLLYQTLHERPLVSAYVSRIAAPRFAAFRADPVLGRLVAAQVDSADGSLPTPTEIAAFRARVNPSAYLLRPGYQSAALRRLVTALTAGRNFRWRRLPDGSLLVYMLSGRQP